GRPRGRPTPVPPVPDGAGACGPALVRAAASPAAGLLGEPARSQTDARRGHAGRSGRPGDPRAERRGLARRDLRAGRTVLRTTRGVDVIGSRGGDRFPTTRRSAITGFHSDDPAERSRSLDTLVRAYWKPVYKHVRLRWGKSVEDAQDLTQAFFL